MSVVFSGTVQGVFTSDGTAQYISLPTGVDWMRVTNLSVASATGADTGAEFFWQCGMPAGRGIIYTKLAADDALKISEIAAGAGFYRIDTSVNTPGALIATTGINNALPPVVTTGSTAGLSNGDIVRLYAPAGALQLGGVDFTVADVRTDTSFQLINMAAIAAATPLAGSYRRIPYNPLYYPSSRIITKISAVAGTSTALVTLSVTHAYVVGQKIRFVIPRIDNTYFGMTELDGVEATIVAINATDGTSTNTITVNVDVSGFAAFVWPLTTSPRSTFPQVVPVGESTATALSSGSDILSDATLNTGFTGMKLMAGANSPGGVAGNTIYWIAGKSAG
jgi:hypothetical protein